MDAGRAGPRHPPLFSFRAHLGSPRPPLLAGVRHGAGGAGQPAIPDDARPQRDTQNADDGILAGGGAEPYRRLAEVFHDVLSEQSLDALLERIADTLAELIPYEDVHIYEADEVKRELIPVLARSKWADEVMSETFSFGEGITGWAVEHREPLAPVARLARRPDVGDVCLAPAVAGDVVFFTTTTFRPAALCSLPDANLYALTFIGGAAAKDWVEQSPRDAIEPA